MPEQKPADDDRGSLARPPWLPEEKQRRRIRLGRGKRPEKADDAKAADEPVNGDTNGHGSVAAEVPAETTAAPPPQAEADEATPESRPRRVAVRSDAALRLQRA